MLLIDAIKPNAEQKLTTFFTRVFRGGKSGDYKITRTKTSITYAKENDKERERRKERERKVEGEL